jgi:SAM-dependent methyltransferase
MTAPSSFSKGNTNQKNIHQGEFVPNSYLQWIIKCILTLVVFANIPVEARRAHVPISETELKINVTRGQLQYLISPSEFEEFKFESGDSLDILPKKWANQLVKSVDGHRHILLSPGKAIRIPEKMILTPHNGYLIPEHLAILTGVGTEGFDSIGKLHMQSYYKHMGLWPELTFLEIGCGIGRDVFQLLPLIGELGTYIGVDVTQDSILWLKKNITPFYPNFTFYHFDARHEIYNPLGSKTSLDFSLPAPDCSVDRMSIGSVFTHLFENEIVHYLQEIRRVLKPDGLAYATFFLYSKEAVDASRAKSMTPFNLRFEHPNGDGCFVNDAFYKTGAVAYTYEALLRMVNKAGLKLAQPIIRGSWSGLFPGSDDGQDVLILTSSDND